MRVTKIATIDRRMVLTSLLSYDDITIIADAWNSPQHCQTFATIGHTLRSGLRFCVPVANDKVPPDLAPRNTHEGVAAIWYIRVTIPAWQGATHEYDRSDPRTAFGRPASP